MPIISKFPGGSGGGIKLESIAITTPPSKTTYTAGDTFSTSGMVVTATYSNGATAIATGYAFSPSTPLVDGTQSVTIQYTESGVTKTTEQAITVIHKLNAINVTTQPTKTVYEYSDAFDPSGMVITATYSDGVTASVSDYQWEPSTFQSLGSHSVGITYSEGNVQSSTMLFVTVNRKTIQIVPTQSGSLTYSGGTKSPSWNNYNAAQLTIGGTTSAINAGSYAATFTPTANYRWSDGTGAKSVSWSIAKAAGSLTISKTSMSLTASATTDTITVTRAGNGAITATSSDTSVAAASVSGTTVTVTGLKNGSATITVKVAAGTNHNAPANKTCTVSVAFANVFGVVWNYANSSTALTRLTATSDPNGFVTTNITTEPVPAAGTGAGSSPFDAYAPWKDMDEYNIINGVVSYRKGQSGFSRTAHDTMVYIPEYYYKIMHDSPNSKQYFYISSNAKDGFEKHPGSGKYVARYNTKQDHFSKTGGYPLVALTRSAFRISARSKGSKWGLYDYASWCAVLFLYLVEFADWDSQSRVGRGIVDSTVRSVIGKTDTMAYHTGSAAGNSGMVAVQYRHIENQWGNAAEFIDGINFFERTSYAFTNHETYEDDTSSGYTVSAYSAGSNGFITSINHNETVKWMFAPLSVGGSEITYISDYYKYATSWRILSVGGEYNAGTQSGLFAFNRSHTSNEANAYTGSRLMFHP